MDSGADQTALDARVTALGLARTDIPRDKTITPLAFGERDAGAQTVAAPPRAAELLARDIALPTISIDGRDDRGAPSEYAILSTIGEGGMGRVHLARQRSLARDVALKTLKPDASRAVHDSLLREARLTGSLEHPGVIPVHALGVDDQGRPMLIMKRVQGVELGTLLDDPDHPSWKGRSADRLVASIEILSQLCLTVAFAHSRDVIHRDIKPENVMVGGFGEVYLLDWGIATTRGQDDHDVLVGTPVYLAPEMALGQPVDARTDVYLLGATLHHLLVGRAPHDGKTIADVLRTAMVSAPIAYAPEIPEELAALANRAMSRDPKARPATAEDFRHGLIDFLRHKSARALTDAALERLASLERILDGAGDKAPADLATAYRLAAEARFGLTQSLNEHGDDDAKEGMRRCLAIAIELELRQGHAETADALHREMNAPPADLAPRIAAARARATERERERERLELLDRDLDPTEHASKRTFPLLLVAFALVGVGGFIAIRGNDTVTIRSMVAAGGFGFATVLGGVFVIRRRLLTNAFNRRIAAMTVAASFAVFVHRLLALTADANPQQTLTSDLMIFGFATAAIAITLLRELWICTAVAAAGAICTRIWPDDTPVIFTMTLLITLVTATILLARARR